MPKPKGLETRGLKKEFIDGWIGRGAHPIRPRAGDWLAERLEEVAVVHCPLKVFTRSCARAILAPISVQVMDNPDSDGQVFKKKGYQHR